MDSCVPRSFVKANFKNIPPELGVISGYFAGNAWMRGKEEFAQISGESFGFHSFKDEQSTRESKYIMTVPTLEEWNSLTDKQKELCYRAYGDLSQIKFYSIDEVNNN